MSNAANGCGHLRKNSRAAKRHSGFFHASDSQSCMGENQAVPRRGFYCIRRKLFDGKLNGQSPRRFVRKDTLLTHFLLHEKFACGLALVLGQNTLLLKQR